MSYMTNFLLSVVGPTAVGKTALSITLAKHFQTEIISADSRQFFKEMRIGTAVPGEEDLTVVNHHFIQHKSIHDEYNVGAFEQDTLAVLRTLYKNLDVVIMVGGSGLYLKAITDGLDDFPDIDPDIREVLNTRLKKEGLKALQDELHVRDPLSYSTIAIDNPHRVIRALEICIGTDKPYSSFLNAPKAKRNFKTLTIGLTANRDIIYNRINDRVDQMISEGLIEEARSLLPFKHLNALNTVGYKELFKYFNKECNLEFAVSEIKKNSRRFAKRQLTWFRKDESIKWFDFEDDPNQIIQYINSNITS